MKSNLVNLLERNPRSNKSPVLLRRQIGWNRVLVQRKVTSQNKSLTRAQLQRSIDYIHTHLDQNLSIVQLAKVINISPTYFANLFKCATGISPHQYVIQQRVKRANLLLRTTDLSISDIAFQVGFSSQSHLTQQFKRLTHLTPKQVR